MLIKGGQLVLRVDDNAFNTKLDNRYVENGLDGMWGRVLIVLTPIQHASKLLTITQVYT